MESRSCGDAVRVSEPQIATHRVQSRVQLLESFESGAELGCNRVTSVATLDRVVRAAG